MPLPQHWEPHRRDTQTGEPVDVVRPVVTATSVDLIEVAVTDSIVGALDSGPDVDGGSHPLQPLCDVRRPVVPELGARYAPRAPGHAAHGHSLGSDSLVPRGSHGVV